MAPSINQTIEFGDQIRVILPVDMRVVLWDAFDSETRKYVTVNGVPNTPTVVTIQPIPGYTPRTAEIVALTAYVFATDSRSFEEFLKLSLQELTRYLLRLKLLEPLLTPNQATWLKKRSE